MTGQQIIDEITDDRVGLVSQFRYDPANQSAAAPVPFQIDRTVRGLAMDFGPTVRATGSLMFSGNQIKPPELRIGHDLFPQRPTPGGDDLDHCLHPPRFNRKSSLLQCLFVVAASLCRDAMASSVPRQLPWLAEINNHPESRLRRRGRMHGGKRRRGDEIRSSVGCQQFWPASLRADTIVFITTAKSSTSHKHSRIRFRDDKRHLAKCQRSRTRAAATDGLQIRWSKQQN
jgi:hypothetical protein